MLKYLFIAFAAVVLTAFAHVLLKLGATRNLKYSWRLKQYMNFYVCTGYLIFIFVTIMNVYSYKYLPLKYAIIILPFTFIFVTLFSIIFFKETIKKRQWISYILIIIGIVIYNLK